MDEIFLTVKTKIVRHKNFDSRQLDIDTAYNEISESGCMIDSVTTFDDFESVIRYFEPVKPGVTIGIDWADVGKDKQGLYVMDTDGSVKILTGGIKSKG